MIDLNKITVIVPGPGDNSHAFGVFRFGTWAEAKTFVGKLAALEQQYQQLKDSQECSTCSVSLGCAVPTEQEDLCDGSCGDGCTTAKRIGG